MAENKGQGPPFGVILAGGRATRMGGGDKGLFDLGGQRIIDHAIARLRPQVSRLALNANGDPERFSDLGLPVLADPMAGYPGPLAGVLAGLDWAAAEGAAAIVTVAADTPFVPADLVQRLQAAASPQGLALAAARDEDGVVRRHPTVGLWPVALRDNLRAALADGLRKIVAWTDRHHAGQAEFPDAQAFFNVNTPEDLAQARTLLLREDS